MNPAPSMLPEPRLKPFLDQIEPGLQDALAGFYALDTDTGMFCLNRASLNADAKRPALDAAVRAAGVSATQFHHPNSTYQYYDMARLWQDIETAFDAGLSCIHLAVAPLRASDIHARLLGTDMTGTGAKLHSEDMRTCHADQWGCEGPYLEDAATVLNRLTAFFNDQLDAS